MNVSLSELIAEYGEENLSVQVLSEALDCQQSTHAKDDTTRLSLRTTRASLAAVMTGKVEALVVWIDKAKMRAALKRVQARTAAVEGR